jgi:hypothetical protein
MNEYTPDRWVVLRINDLYKVLAGWSGGYLHGDSWKLNSGITKVVEDGDYFLFHGYSGSVYRCHKQGYGLNMMTAQMLNTFEKHASEKGLEFQKLPEETNWLEIQYE